MPDITQFMWRFDCLMILLLACLLARLKEKQVSDAKTTLSEFTAIIASKDDKRHKLLSSSRACADTIAKAEEELKDIEEEESQARVALDQQCDKLKSLDATIARLRPVEEVERDIQAVDKEIQALRQAGVVSSRQVSDVSRRIDDARTSKAQIEARLQSLNARPVTTPLMKFTRNLNQRTRAELETEMLKVNELSSRFLSKVHGPLLTCIKVADNKCAAYVENVITGTLRSAWVTDNQQDFKTLVDAKIRNVLHGPPLTKPNRQWNLASFKEHGIDGLHYLDEAIECEDIIRSVLYDSKKLSPNQIAKAVVT